MKGFSILIFILTVSLSWAQTGKEITGTSKSKLLYYKSDSLIVGPPANKVLVIVDAHLTDEDGNLVVNSYESAQISVTLSNKAQATAQDISLAILREKASMKGFAFVMEQKVDDIFPEQTLDVSIDITGLINPKDETAVFIIDALEKGNWITSSKEIPVKLKPLNSDIDFNIPVNPRKSDRIALIIGNEDYSLYQGNLTTRSNVRYALNDARIFSQYAKNLLGINENNLFTIYNATKDEMSQQIELVANLAEDLGENAEIIFYYAGHGFPEELTRDPYLIPVDVSPSNLTDAVWLLGIYDRFSRTKAKKVTMILDVCFNGGGREVGLIDTIQKMTEPLMEGVRDNFVIFLASSGDQSAQAHDQQQHGLLTYFFLKKLQETSGKVTYGEMEEYLEREVLSQALKINQKPQDPEVQTGINIKDNWSKWVFY